MEKNNTPDSHNCTQESFLPSSKEPHIWYPSRRGLKPCVCSIALLPDMEINWVRELSDQGILNYCLYILDKIKCGPDEFCLFESSWPPTRSMPQFGADCRHPTSEDIASGSLLKDRSQLCSQYWCILGHCTWWFMSVLASPERQCDKLAAPGYQIQCYQLQ